MSEVQSIIKNLVNNSEKKIEFLLQMKKSTEKQKVSIVGNDIQGLMDQIQIKADLIDEINKLDIQFVSDYKILKEILGVESVENVDIGQHPELSDLKANIFKIMEILKEIKKIDDKNSKEVNIEYNELKAKMKDVSHNIKVSKGYNTNYNHAQGVFIDNKK